MNLKPRTPTGGTGAPTAACANCRLRALYPAPDLSPQQFKRLDSLVLDRRSVNRGKLLFRSGESLDALYAVRTGYFKTKVSTFDGREQVTGFHMAGEVLGLDAVDGDRHRCDAVAIEDSQVCVIPYAPLERLMREFSALQRQFHKIMSGEIVRTRGVMVMLASMRAEARVAAFLLDLSQCLQARGFSPSDLVLRMTRAEIASYLGLKVETVSRCFSRLHNDHVLQVRKRHVRIVDGDALHALLNTTG